MGTKLKLNIPEANIVWPDASIPNAAIDPNTDIDADKLEHLYKPHSNFALAIGDAPVAYEEIVFTASTAGVIRAVHALLNDTGTDCDVSFDCKVNGTTVLSSTISVSETESDREVVDGTLATDPHVLAIGDVVSLQLALVGTPAQNGSGPFAWAEIQELSA